MIERLFAGIILSLGLILPCYAQELRQTLESEVEEVPPKVISKVDSYYRYMPSVKADSQPGKVSLAEAATEYSYEMKAFGKMPVEFSLSSKYIGIDDTVGVSLPTQLTDLEFGAEATVPLFNFKNTYFRLSAYPSFYGDSWSFNASDFRIASNYIVIWQPDKSWTFVCGVSYTPDTSGKYFPILGFIYKPNKKLIFNIIPERPNITYLLNNKIALFLEAEMEMSEYDVNKDGYKKAALQYNEFSSGAGISINLNKYFKASVSGGEAFCRSLKYRDNVGKVIIGNGAYIEARINADF